MSPKQKFMAAKELEAIAAYNAVMENARAEWREMYLAKKHEKNLTAISERGRNPSRNFGEMRLAKTVSAPEIRPSFVRSLFSSLISALIY